MEFNKQQRGQIFSQLPENIKDVFTARKTTVLLKGFGDQYSFTDEERRYLGEEVGLVLLGVNTPKEMQERLYEKMSQPKEGVNKIVRQVQENVFRSIRNDLRKLNPKKLLEESDEEYKEKEVDAPIPPPPGNGNSATPSPSYGGSSDPYREPVDE